MLVTLRRSKSRAVCAWHPWISLGAMVIAACSSGPSSPAAPESSLGDAGIDAPLPCLLCADAGVPIWTDTTLPLAPRMRDMLRGCTGAEACHAQGIGGLTISSNDPFTQLIDVRAIERPDLFRVAPGDPDRSYMLLKLVGDGGIEGGAMPSGLPRDPRRAELAREWIEAGAAPE